METWARARPGRVSRRSRDGHRHLGCRPLRASPSACRFRVRNLGHPRSRRRPGADGRRDRPERAHTGRATSTRGRPRRTHPLGPDGHRGGHRSRRRGDRVTCRRRLRRRRPGGEQRERVEVPVRVGGQPDAEVNIRLRSFGLAARADRPHDLPLDNRRSDRQSDRSQVDEGDRVPAFGADRQAEPFARQPAGVGDDPRGWSAHLGSRRSADVDAAVLTARIGIVRGHEWPEHRPLDRPAPRCRARDVPECDEEHSRQADAYVARFENHARATYRAGRLLSNLTTAKPGRACSEPGRSDGRRRPPPAVALLRPGRALRLQRARPLRLRRPARARRGRE